MRFFSASNHGGVARCYFRPFTCFVSKSGFFGGTAEPVTLETVMHAMADYADREAAAEGTRINNIARHMLGLANGLPGARQFRQILSVDACKPGADSSVMLRALDAVTRPRLAEAS